MQLKLNSFCKSLIKKQKYQVSHLAWNSTHGLLFSGDFEIRLLDLNSENSSIYCSLSSCHSVTCLNLFILFTVPSNSKNNSEILAIATAEGRLLILTKGAQLEKVVDAHNGSICCIQWNYDGTSLATCGEDGVIKIWSRLGMLRTTLVLSEAPIYSFSWSPNDDQFIYTKFDHLVVKSVQKFSNGNQWRAHDSLILSLDWSKQSGLIVSGDENGCIKVWNSYAVLQNSIIIVGTTISTLSWASNHLFAFGGLNLYGVLDQDCCIIYLQSNTIFGHIYEIAWSKDGMQLAFPTKSGDIFLSYISPPNLNYLNYIIDSRYSFLLLQNLSTNTVETYDFATRIIQVRIDFGYLVILTKLQCMIYPLTLNHTPVEIDLRNIQHVSTFMQTDLHIIILTIVNTFYIYSYDGKSIISSITPSNLFALLFQTEFAFTSDILVLLDNNSSILNVFDVSLTKFSKKYSINHSLQITRFLLSPKCTNSWRQLCFVDKANDLFILPLLKSNVLSCSPRKISSFTNSFVWHDKYSILAAIQNNILVIWFNPFLIFTDPDIQPLTIIKFYNVTMLKDAQLTNFAGNICTLRLHDGSLFSVSIVPHFISLCNYINSQRWNDAHRMCTIIQEKKLWAFLALSAASNGILQISRFAYANTLAIDRVDFIDNYILSENLKSYFSFIMHDLKNLDLDGINNFLDIQNNIKTFNWDRALSLAIKFESHIDTIIALRVKYLHCLSLDETRKKFKQFSDLDIDWERISLKLTIEDKKRHIL